MAKRVAYEKFWWLHIVCSFAMLILILSKPGLLTLLLGLPIIVGLYLVFILFVFWRPTYHGLSGIVRLPELIFWQCYYIALIIVSFASLFASSGIIKSDDMIVKDFVSSIYFSLVTFTTLGYGDFKPTEEIRFFAATEALLGYLCMGVFVGTVATVLYEIGSKVRNGEGDS
jgi:hypothetical protein